jgi:peptide/nickel transport system substrate-binding protein
MKKAFFILIAFILLFGMVLVACAEPEEPTPAPTTPTPTTPAEPEKPAPTTPAEPEKPAPTTPAEPEKPDMYGGIFKQALTVGPARPIGYPPEAAPDSYTGAAPALETLVRVKLGGVVVPVLATSWEVSKDPPTITLTLRQGVKFHDGSDFNAEVCKWNLDTRIEAKKTTDWKSVDIIDDYTIRINLAGYKNTSLTGLASGVTQQISKKSFDENGIEWARWHPVGTGPFLFEEYERDAKLTYKRNPNYWDPEKPYLEGLEFTVIADETVRKIAFQKGDIHRVAASGLTAQELQQAGYVMVPQAGGTFLLIPDSLNPDSPWADLRVRLAASHALNREALADALGFGFASPAYQIYPGFPESAIPNLNIHEFNQARARELLADAGYPDGFPTKIHAFTRIVPADFINAVANQLREVGIDVTTDFPEAGKYEELRYGGWNDGLMGHGIAGFDNKNQTWSFYFMGLQFPSVKKPVGWTEAAEASLASDEVDPKLVQAVIQIMHDNVMTIPYMEETAVAFFQEGVHDPNIEVFPLLTIVYQDIWLDPDLR